MQDLCAILLDEVKLEKQVLPPPFSVDYRTEHATVQCTKCHKDSQLSSINSSVDAHMKDTEFPTLLPFEEKLDLITEWQQTMGTSDAQCRGACAVCAYNVCASSQDACTQRSLRCICCKMIACPNTHCHPVMTSSCATELFCIPRV